MDNQQVNERIKTFLIGIQKFNCNEIDKKKISEKNEEIFEKMLWEKYIPDCFGECCVYLNTEQWQTQYVPMKSISSKMNFDFRGFDFPYTTSVVYQPNGTQKWPDLMLIHNKIGLPIEIKTSQNDKIIWNGGLPRINGIYISKCTSTKINDGTYFLGQDVLTTAEREILLEYSDLAAQININISDKIPGSTWSLYIRDMYNTKMKYIGHPERAKRESNVLEYVDALTWDENQYTYFASHTSNDGTNRVLY